MISRRSFLIGAGAGLILPRFFEQALAQYENHGEALLHAPEQVGTTLIASREYSDNFQLLLGDIREEPPSMTVAEYVERYSFLSLEEAAQEYADWGLSLDDQMPWDYVCDAWCLKDSPNARAFELLSGFDLGSLKAHGDRKIGEILFINGPCPGNDYRGVEAPTELDLSLLQNRLNQLRSGVSIEIS